MRFPRGIGNHEGLAPGYAARGPAGFTLVELLVVTAIIGILAAIAMSKYISIKKRANEGKTKHELSIIRQAMVHYQLDHDNAYPPTVHWLVPDYMSGAAGVFIYELVGEGPENGNWVYDLPTPNVNDSLNRTISGPANLGGWRYASDNGDVWIDEDGTSVIDDEEFRLW